MKIPSDISLQTGKEYCIQCFHDPVAVTKKEEGKQYLCATCGHMSNRRISTDASIRWWIDPERNFWHESVGIFVFNHEGKILFFELTKFPFGLTVPAGHRDAAEEPVETARRELLEETGLHSEVFNLLGKEDIIGDSCSRGADAHTWHAFMCVPDSFETFLDSAEGKNAVWLSLEEVLKKDLTVPVKYFIDRYADALRKASVEAKR